MHNYGEFRGNSSDFQYFKYLAHSFTEGRLDLEECPYPTNCHDLVLFNDKIYLYWPPVPALAYIPLVAIYDFQTPDQAISHILGAVNVLLFFLVNCKVFKTLSIENQVLADCFIYPFLWNGYCPFLSVNERNCLGICTNTRANFFIGVYIGVFCRTLNDSKIYCFPGCSLL